MDGERILLIIIMVATNWVCALTFFLIGRWAARRKDPMHFYSGTKVDPKTISDIPAYNHANAKMWKLFSIPFWFAGIIGFFNAGASAIIMSISCFPGMFWLLWKYRRICAQYQIR